MANNRSNISEAEQIASHTDAVTAGAVTAKYLKADPAFWLKCASEAGLIVDLVDDRLFFYWEFADGEETDFLMCWLNCTEGGKKAVTNYLRH